MVRGPPQLLTPGRAGNYLGGHLLQMGGPESALGHPPAYDCLVNMYLFLFLKTFSFLVIKSAS